MRNATATARLSCARPSTRRFGRSCWRRHQLDRRGWTSTSTVMRWCIGTCPRTRLTWSSERDACTGTRGMRFARTWPRHIRERRSPRRTAIPGRRSSTRVPFTACRRRTILFRAGSSPTVQARIERHVPILPFSRDEARLAALKRSLAAYRLAFGQPRQEDLVAFLERSLDADEVARVSEELRIDLAPRDASRVGSPLLARIASRMEWPSSQTCSQSRPGSRRRRMAPRSPVSLHLLPRRVVTSSRPSRA